MFPFTKKSPECHLPRETITQKGRHQNFFTKSHLVHCKRQTWIVHATSGICTRVCTVCCCEGLGDRWRQCTGIILNMTYIENSSTVGHSIDIATWAASQHHPASTFFRMPRGWPIASPCFTWSKYIQIAHGTHGTAEVNPEEGGAGNAVDHNWSTSLECYSISQYLSTLYNSWPQPIIYGF